MEPTQIENGKVLNMSPANLGTALKEAASFSQLFSDVCTIFAMRERSRAKVTVNTLKRAVEEAKLLYSKEDCRKVLTILAKYGIGRPVKDARGQIKAIVDIKYTLQSIGLTAIGNEGNLKPFHPRVKQVSVPVVQKQESAAPVETKLRKASPPVSNITITIGDKKIDINLTPEQILELMASIIK